MNGSRRMRRSGTRWCLWRWTDVVLGGALYLRRLHLVQTPWFAVMLHWIYKADPQPDMHDHPVSFLSIPLRGGYIEMVPAPEVKPTHRRPEWSRARIIGPFPPGCSTYHRQRFWLNVKRATDRHRIASVSPGGCVTLVFAGPVVREWGFHTPSRWVPWREYNANESKRAA